MGELDGKVAFLTGAGRGVGVGIAMALAKAGATFGLFGRTRETLEGTASLIAEVGGRSLICVGDTGVRSDVAGQPLPVMWGRLPIRTSDQRL